MNNLILFLIDNERSEHFEQHQQSNLYCFILLYSVSCIFYGLLIRCLLFVMSSLLTTFVTVQEYYNSVHHPVSLRVLTSNLESLLQKSHRKVIKHSQRVGFFWLSMTKKINIGNLICVSVYCTKKCSVMYDEVV